MLTAILAGVLCGALVGWIVTARELKKVRREARAIAAEMRELGKARLIFGEERMP